MIAILSEEKDFWTEWRDRYGGLVVSLVAHGNGKRSSSTGLIIVRNSASPERQAPQNLGTEKREKGIIIIFIKHLREMHCGNHFGGGKKEVRKGFKGDHILRGVQWDLINGGNFDLVV